MNETVVDFIVLGGAKCGTTSLFRYLDAHPAIEMAIEKEVQFFSSDERYSLGLDWYRHRWSTRDDRRVLKGEASPQYLQSPLAPERIAAFAPHARLIAILRNPVDRAFSHYHHAVRHYQESRSFVECVRMWVGTQTDPQAVLEDNDSLYYFEESRYGRALESYLRLFAPSQIKIVFAEQMWNDASQVTQDIYGWLGIDDSFNSSCFSETFNGGTESRIASWYNWSRVGIHRLLEKRGIDFSLQSRLPNQLRQYYESLQLRLLTEGSTPSKEFIESSTRALLVEHYWNDVARLQTATGVSVPWAEFSGVPSAHQKQLVA